MHLRMMEVGTCSCYRILVIAVAALSTGCQVNGDGEMEPADLPDALARGIETHGGLDTWRSFGRLEFHVEKPDIVEHHTIDLQSRKLLIASDRYVIGFNGEDVWITPGLDAYPGDARFYSSLNFYFFGLPFLLADPGTVHEDLGRRTIDGTDYDVVKVSFEEGVGDAPDDYYLAHFNTQTGTMDLLLYTVTYRSGEPEENYHARTYEWQEEQGLLVPAKMSSYRWNAEEDALGEHRSDTRISKVMFSEERPDPGWFEMPHDAEVAPMPAGR